MSGPHEELYARTDEYVAVPGLDPILNQQYPDRPVTVPEHLWKDYWNRRRETERYFQQRQKERARLQKIRDQVSRNKRRLATLLPPTVSIENKWPRGCYVRWIKPTNWDPDDYRVLVRLRGSGDDGWRSVASINVTFETREMYLSPSYLYWNDSDAGQDVEIKVEAIWDGVGNVASQSVWYAAIPQEQAPVPKPTPAPKPTPVPMSSLPPYGKHEKPADIPLIAYVTWWRNNPVNSRWQGHRAHTDKYDQALLFLGVQIDNPHGLRAFSESEVRNLARRGQPGFRAIRDELNRR